MTDFSLIPPPIRDTRSKAISILLDRQNNLGETGILANLYNPALCLEAVLPFLAEQFGVLDEAWFMATTVEKKRSLVQNALLLQMKRGTPWSIRNALAAVGWPGMVITERSSDWWKFKISQPLGSKSLTSAELAKILSVVEAWKPARCQLDTVELTLAFESDMNVTTPRHDSTYHHDAEIKYEGPTVDNLSYVMVGEGTPTVKATTTTISDGIGQKVISFTLNGATANGLTLNAYSICTAAGTVIARASSVDVEKTVDVSLTGTWTLNLN